MHATIEAFSAETTDKSVLTDEAVDFIDRYWRAANYLSVGQIYLLDNPLLREPLEREHIKPRLLGHWGTTPGLNFIYTHLNRIIRERNQDVLFVCGPGHGGPALLAQTWLEGSYSELYPEISPDLTGMRRLFRQFSFPGGVPSHASPETPGSIHEGGELGYSLVHAFGAAFDNPDLVVACVIGDGEAETGPLAASWHGNKFLDPVRDGAVLPILHLNGYKIANPTVLGRMNDGTLHHLFEGLGYEPIFVEGSDPARMHRRMAAAMDQAFDLIRHIQTASRENAMFGMPRWPVIVLRSPKGWTGPKEVDGKKVEGSWRAHQVPVAQVREDQGHRRILEQWMQSYRPEELFDREGRLIPELRALAPEGDKRMGANPQANGGSGRQTLCRPDWREFAVSVPRPGGVLSEATRFAGAYLAEVMRQNADRRNFRIMGPDETCSNRLDAVLGVTDRAWMAPIEPGDEHLAQGGRVMEVLSEHLCQGWLEGYTLTGRHGVFNCYEAFIHIVGSMFNQHAKWLKVAREIDWRRPVPSFNYLLSSHVWRQDHNGFSHQDPGFLDLVVNKKADIVRIYLPPDANCLLRTTDHCLGTHDRINVIVAGKQPALQWLSAEQAEIHCAAGAGIWEWAGTEKAGEVPDVVLACAGDVPTTETLAAVDLLRRYVPHLKTRVVNVVDLLTLQHPSEHPHGLADAEFNALFTADRPVIFAFHGYPWLVHRLAYRRTNHVNLHVHGFREEGTTTTPFDMLVRNELDRFHLALAAIERVPGALQTGAHAVQLFRDTLIKHEIYVCEHGEDMPVITDWCWPANSGNAEQADHEPGM
ncbi:phosphoketolase family protein [Sphingomonas adhaesiva]|uniref:Probable phosphoketolase n=1 Tax=Sphingomonas adhaesiva TaxID=28212 RepID=A0A2A4I5C9_9SPHN|nr:phosphoketolase family protein [Sphingomonas adhaesiva]PCG12993.1 phosphoketolase [Sphingomonas adhaesiva]